MVKMSVDLGGLKLESPIATASGTFGYGTEYLGAVDYSKLGAITAKGIRIDSWPGNPMPRHVEVPGGIVTQSACKELALSIFSKSRCLIIVRRSRFR